MDNNAEAPGGSHTMAAMWLARLRSDSCTPQDHAAFQAWIAASETNAHSFEKVTAVWDMVGGCGLGARAGGPGAVQPCAVETPGGEGLAHEHSLPPAYTLPRPHAFSRRKVLAGTLGFAVVGLGGAGYWENAMAGTLETGIGEKRQLVMKNGTRLLMDALTRLRVPDMAGDAIWLGHGRVDVQLAAAAAPFALHCADGKVLCRQGRFMVSHMTDNNLEVLAVEGRALWSGQQDLVLQAGQRMVRNDDRQQIDRPDVVEAQAWQQGDAIFRDTPLQEAVFEMNRYSAQRLVLQDEELAQKRISGVYRLGDNSAFAISLAHVLNLRSQIGTDEVLIMQPA